MTDLTTQTSLSTAWKDITTALSLAEGSRYLVDITGVDSRGVAFQAETDDANAPTVSGHPVNPATRRLGGVTSRIYLQRDGVRLWMRVDRGDAVVVATGTD